MQLALVSFHVAAETKARPTHLTAGEPSKLCVGRLRLRSMLMTFDVFLTSFIPWHTQNTRSHTY